MSIRSRYRRIASIKRTAIGIGVGIALLGGAYALLLKPQSFSPETWKRLNRVTRKNQEHIATLFHPGLAMSETHAVRFIGLPQFFNYGDEATCAGCGGESTTQGGGDKGEPHPSPVPTSNSQPVSKYQATLRVKPRAKVWSTIPYAVVQANEGLHNSNRVSPHPTSSSSSAAASAAAPEGSPSSSPSPTIIVEDPALSAPSVVHSTSTAVNTSTQHGPSAVPTPTPTSTPPTPMATLDPSRDTPSNSPLKPVFSSSSLSLESSIKSPLVLETDNMDGMTRSSQSCGNPQCITNTNTTTANGESNSNIEDEPDVEILTNRSSLLMYNVNVVRPVDISYDSQPIPFPLKCTRLVMGIIHQLLIHCPQPWDFTYYLRIDTLNIAQDMDIANAINELRRFFDYYEPLGKQMVLAGSSRGAAVTFSILAVIKRDYPDLHQRVLKNVKVIVLDSCFDTVSHTLSQRWGPLSKLMEPVIEVLTPYRRSGSSPLSLVPYFPHEIPVVFVTSKIDRTVNIRCTLNLRDALAKHRYDAFQQYMASNDMNQFVVEPDVSSSCSHPLTDSTLINIPVNGSSDEFITRSIKLKQQHMDSGHLDQNTNAAPSLSPTTSPQGITEKQQQPQPQQTCHIIAPVHTLILQRSRHRGYSVDDAVDAVRYKDFVEAIYDKYIIDPKQTGSR